MHYFLELCITQREIVSEFQPEMAIIYAGSRGPDERSDRAERGSKRGRTVELYFE
jgi:hypothetical protein